MTYQTPEHGFRTFLIVWATQSVSVMGSALTLFAMTIWLTQVLYPLPEDKPQLGLALSAVTLAFALPTVFGAPIAGAWADRHDRKRTMMATDLINGGLSLLLAALIVTRSLQLWTLITLIAAHATVSAFHQSAFDTAYAMLVPERLLPRANGMMQTIWSLSGIISPALAATIISIPALAREGLISGDIGAWLGQMNDGTPLAISLDAVTFLLAAVVLVLLHVPSPKRTDLRAADGAMKKSLWSDVQVGALYIWHRRPMLWLLGTFTVINLLMSPLGTLQPLIVKFNLAEDWVTRGFTFETALALLGSIGSIGGVAGGLFISAWGGLKSKRVYGIIVGMMIASLAQMAIGFSSTLYLTAGLVFLMWSMVPIMNAHSQAIWQTQTPRELQGRVFAVRRLIAQCTYPFSAAFAGLAGGLFNPAMVVGVMGGIAVLFCTAQLFNSQLLRVEDKAWLDAMAARAVGSESA